MKWLKNCNWWFNQKWKTIKYSNRNYKSEFKDYKTVSKIIKILVKAPKIAKKRLDHLSELRTYSYAWITKEFNENIKQEITK